MRATRGSLGELASCLRSLRILDRHRWQNLLHRLSAAVPRCRSTLGCDRSDDSQGSALQVVACYDRGSMVASTVEIEHGWENGSNCKLIEGGTRRDASGIARRWSM
ncbi:hypothetical protein LIA77_01997 [Sarocladium implicatum]|nr:hypothetical protein LIA77_01997 [Sarocladium implicatum]